MRVFNSYLKFKKEKIDMKKNMNKIFAVGCMSAMLMSMCACGANNDTTETTIYIYDI